MRIEGARCHYQPLIELLFRKQLGFHFRFKRFGQPWVSWPWQDAGTLYRKRHVPTVSHRLLDMQRVAQLPCWEVLRT